MNEFELWIDESGDFKNDNDKVKNGEYPSLIGGLLVEKKSDQSSSINIIIPEESTYHSVNETDQLDRFKLVEKTFLQNDTNRFVVFNNQECIMILDDNLTYLNIISEGILQLIKWLKAQYGQISLTIIIANRVDMTNGLNSVVPLDEYEKRLKEKLLIGSYENSISDKEWTLKTESARKEKKLMIADIICNTIFTRYKPKKFNKDERTYIDSVYKDKKKTIVFKVFESVLEKKLERDLLENRTGEAVASVCATNNKKILKKCFDLLDVKFEHIGVQNAIFQYKFIEAYTEFYINDVRDFKKCEIYLKNLLNYYIPILEKHDFGGKDYSLNYLILDIKFYLLTLYTHTGDIIGAKALIKECEEYIEKIPETLNMLNYQIKFKNRKIQNQIDSFDFEGALKSADELVKECKSTKDLLYLISNNEDGNSNKKRVKYDELAKAFGTRMQVKAFMVRNNPGLYESSKKDSDAAISEFDNIRDIQRQYLYRVQLETDHGNYDSALEFLKKSVELPTNVEITELWKRIEGSNIFGVSAFLRLMAESTKLDKAKEMYKVFSKSDHMKMLETSCEVYHPLEIIYWKYASYCAKNGMINAAYDNYKKATNLCFKGNEITLAIIGIGILFEELSIALKNNGKEYKDIKKELQKKWKSIIKKEYEDILLRVFGQVDLHNDDADYYYALSRKITY